jgi:ankyrin repeat protein
VLRALLNTQSPPPPNSPYKLDLNAVCSKGKTALHYCAERGRVPVAQILLDHGADATIQDSTHRTCLYLAVKYSRTSFVNLLLDRGVPFRWEALPKEMPRIIKNLLEEREARATPARRKGSSATSSSRGSIRSTLSRIL